MLNSTAYVVDDVVNLRRFIYMQTASTSKSSNKRYILGYITLGRRCSTLTTQGDILYRDGSGLQRLGAGTWTSINYWR